MEALRENIDHLAHPAQHITSSFYVCNVYDRARHYVEHVISAGVFIPGEDPLIRGRSQQIQYLLQVIDAGAGEYEVFFFAYVLCVCFCIVVRQFLFPLKQKQPLHTGVRAGFQYLVILSVYYCVCVTFDFY